VSATTSAAAAATASPTAVAPPAAVTQAITAAKDLPTLITGLQAVDPALAQAMIPKALIASKTPWGTSLGTVVGWLAGKYGLTCTAATVAASNCWTPETIDLVSGLTALIGTFIASYIMRAITTTRIGGIFSAQPSALPTVPPKPPAASPA